MKPDRFDKPVRFFVSTRHYKFDSVLGLLIFLFIIDFIFYAIGIRLSKAQVMTVNSI
jgi:hypothetical protein